MTKFAFMTFSTPELTLNEVLRAAAEMGYDAIEPRIESQHRHGIELDTSPAERAAIRARAVDSGVPFCCLATSRSYANPATVGDQVELTQRCLDLAADIGAPRLRVFGGALPAGVDRGQAVDMLTEALGSLARYAAERRVTICVETHDDWSDLRPLAEVLARVDHPSVGANWDFIHPAWRVGMSPAESFEILRPWIRHSHVHDAILAPGAPPATTYIGEGSVDHRSAVELLRSIGWDGYLSGEWIGRAEAWEVYLPRELATLKGY